MTLILYWNRIRTQTNGKIHWTILRVSASIYDATVCLNWLALPCSRSFNSQARADLPPIADFCQTCYMTLHRNRFCNETCLAIGKFIPYEQLLLLTKKAATPIRVHLYFLTLNHRGFYTYQTIQKHIMICALWKKFFNLILRLPLHSYGNNSVKRSQRMSIRIDKLNGESAAMIYPTIDSN